jgi:hypothetical protein
MASLRNADDEEPGPKYDDELLADVSADERTVDAPQDENKEHRRIRWLKNTKRAQCRRNVENHTRNRCTKGTSTMLLQQLRIRSITHRLAPL